MPTLLRLAVVLLSAGVVVAEPPEPTLRLPGLRVDRETGSVLVDARVVGQDADWLELIACTPNSREHEALVVVDALPSHVHLALTTLGAEAGQPQNARQLGPGEWQTDPARGPEIAISAIVEGPDGPDETSLHAWYAAGPPPGARRGGPPPPPPPHHTDENKKKKNNINKNYNCLFL
ncbi:MAG: YdjY domain-containing protein [Planctomycetota bacterium]